jgi:hypothetical protein
MEYYFYITKDPLREKVAKTKADSEAEALRIFATLKGLDENEFRKLYTIREWNTAEHKSF